MPPYRGVISILLICALALSTACTSMKTIAPVTAPGRPPFGEVKAGDTVVAHLSSGERVQFVVQQVDGEQLVAKNGARFSRGEITELQRRSFSGPKTALLVGAAVAASVTVALAVAYVGLLGGWQ